MNKYSKAILAFVGLVVTNEVTVLANTGYALPVGVHGWAIAIASTVVGTAAVYLKGNGTSKPVPPEPTPPVTSPL